MQISVQQVERRRIRVSLPHLEFRGSVHAKWFSLPPSHQKHNAVNETCQFRCSGWNVDVEIAATRRAAFKFNTMTIPGPPLSNSLIAPPYKLGSYYLYPRLACASFSEITSSALCVGTTDCHWGLKSEHRALPVGDEFWQSRWYAICIPSRITWLMRIYEHPGPIDSG